MSPAYPAECRRAAWQAQLKRGLRVLEHQFLPSWSALGRLGVSSHIAAFPRQGTQCTSSVNESDRAAGGEGRERGGKAGRASRILLHAEALVLPWQPEGARRVSGAQAYTDAQSHAG